MPESSPTPASSSTDSRCLNCGAVVRDSYCSHCGQDRRKRRLTIQSTLAVFLDEVFDLEQPITRTVLHLTYRPGGLCREYVLGQRRKIINPLKYCLAAAALHTFTIGVFGAEMLPAGEELFPVINSNTEVMDANIEFVEQTLGLISLFMLPILAGFLRLFFWERRVNVAEWYAAMLLVNGHLYVLFYPALILGWLATIPGFLIQTFAGFLFVPFAVSGFLQDRRIGTIAAAFAANLVYTVVVTVLSGIVGIVVQIVGANI